MLRVSKFCKSIEYFDVELSVNKTIVYSIRSFQYVCLKSSDWKKIEQGYSHQLDKRARIELIKSKVLVDESEDELQSVSMQEGLILKKLNSLHFTISPFIENGFMESSFLLYAQSMIEKLEKKILPEHNELVVLWQDATCAKHIEVIQVLTPELQNVAQKYSLDYYSDILIDGISIV